MKTKYITPKEYAEIKGCTVQNISKHIRNGNGLKLPFVKNIKYFGRFYLLEIDSNGMYELGKIVKFKNKY